MRETGGPSGSGNVASPFGWCLYCGHAHASLGRLEFLGERLAVFKMYKLCLNPPKTLNLAGLI